MFMGPLRRPGPVRWAYMVICLIGIAILLWQIKRMLGSMEGLSKP